MNACVSDGLTDSAQIPAHEVRGLRAVLGRGPASDVVLYYVTK